jgi:ADP-ribosylglycohydrolase
MNYSYDKILGCLVGGAIGDAVGGVRERGRICLSDDTQMTLATCEAIQTSGSASPEAIAGEFSRWFRAGAITGVGSSTLKALRDLSNGVHWALSGARGEMAAGNGAAMRIAPLAFLLNPHNREHRLTIRDICRITHHDDEAYLGALAVVLAIHVGDSKQDSSLFAEITSSLPDSRIRDRLAEFETAAVSLQLREIVERFGASGYVVETVPLALHLAQQLSPDNFDTVFEKLNDVDGDTDTIGTIAGQIAGARLGLAQLPRDMVSLPAVQEVIPAAEAFAKYVHGNA